jgi:hypothetical protein
VTVFSNNPVDNSPSPSPAVCVGGQVQHGFLTEWGANGDATSLTQIAQSQAAAFFANGTLPPPLVGP